MWDHFVLVEGVFPAIIIVSFIANIFILAGLHFKHSPSVFLNSDSSGSSEDLRPVTNAPHVPPATLDG